VLSNGKGTIFIGLTECMISRGGLREVERIHPPRGLGDRRGIHPIPLWIGPLCG